MSSIQIQNPFPGPLPYRAADRALFHGREEAARLLAERILAHRCVTVYGPSGSGKSSLMQAAVIPALVEAHAVEVARVQGWPAGEDPTRWLAGALHRDLGFGDAPADVAPGEAVMLAARRAARRSSRLLLVFLDQMEQLFHAGRSADEAAAFFEGINALAELPLRGVRLLLSLREDYLGRFLDRLRDRRWILEHGFRIAPLTVAELTAVACRAAAEGEPSQTWSAEEIRPLLLQVRAPGQAASGEAEAQAGAAQVVCRALFQRRARGSQVVDTSITGVFQVDSATAALLGAGHFAAAERSLAPELQRVLQGARSFTVVLGDDREDRARLLHRLTDLLLDSGEDPEEGSTLRELMQLCLERLGEAAVHELFEQGLAASRAAPSPPPLVAALGRLAPPGVHLTLLWEPHLARAIAAQQPGRTVYAVQPSLQSAGGPPRILRRAAGAAGWTVEPALPAALDLDRDVVVLRLYGSYSTKARPTIAQPLAEGDAVHDLLAVEGQRPPPWMEPLLTRPRARPGLFLGLTLLDWRHRMLLRWLYDQRPAPPGSLALLAPSADPGEAELWERGAGLPGAAHITPLTEDPTALAPLLEAFTPAALSPGRSRP